MVHRSLSNRPLLATRRDAPLFVGRTDERANVLSALRYGWNVLVTGERGSGKTSLARLLWLGEDARDLGEPVFVSAAGARHPAEVVGRVAGDLARTPPSGPFEPEDLPRLLATLPSAQERGPRPVVILDDVPGELGHATFGTLRDEMWGVGVQWLVIADDTHAGVLLQPPADAFFEAVVRLGPMSTAELRELVTLRLQVNAEGRDDLPIEGLDSSVLDEIVASTSNPRHALAEVRQVLLTGRNDRQAREQALARLGRPAHMLYVEIAGAGPVSASDERLQERMGWTRPRLVQVLNDLEQAGLVVSTTTSSGGAGRPRKMYSTEGVS